jgi:hypothetical protein
MARELETAANDVRHLAVDYLRRSCELHAEAALTSADRLDETAELARLLRNGGLQEEQPIPTEHGGYAREQGARSCNPC